MACEIIKKQVNWVEDFTINEMQEMQRNLLEKYKDKWEDIRESKTSANLVFTRVSG